MLTKFGLGIRDWNDLDDVRNNLGGQHILMNDLDSTTAGYEELASPTANGEKAGSRNSLYNEIGNNCLPQGDATIITGYLPVGKNLKTAAFQ